MTNKEAITILTHNLMCRELIDNPYQYEALDHAIKALEAYDKILPLLNPDIDAELALEKIREVIYD